MSRNAIGCLAMMCLCSGAPAKGPADAIPSNALIVVEAHQPLRCAEQALKLDAVRALADAEAGEALGQAALGLARLGALHVTGAPLDTLVETFTNGVALAVLDGEAGKEGAPWVLAADLGDRAKNFDALWRDRVLPRLAELPGVSIRPRKLADVQGHILLMPNGQSLSIARVRQYLLVGANPGVQAAVRVVRGQTKSIAVGKAFRRVAAPLRPEVGLLVWLDVQAVRARVTKGSPQDPRELREQEKLGVADVRSLGIAASIRDGLVEERAVVELAEERRGLLGILSELTPRPVEAASRIPGDYEAYAVVAFKDGVELESTIEELARRMDGEAAAAKWRNGLTQVGDKLQVNLRTDIFDSLGKELFVAIKARKQSAGQPLTWSSFDIIFGAHCTNAKRIIQTANLIFTADWAVNMGLLWNLRNVNKVAVHTLGFPAKPMLSPTYAEVDGYLLFSLRESALIEAVKALQQRKTLGIDAALARAAGKPGAATIEIGARLQPFVNLLIRAARKKGGRKIKPWLTYMTTAAKGLSAAHLRLGPHDLGFSLRCRSPIGLIALPTAAISAGELLKNPTDRKIETAREHMKRIGYAVKRYVAKHGAYPASLQGLTPRPLKSVPLDPFGAPGKAGFRYRAFGRPGDAGAGWLVISRGPDRVWNIPLDTLDLAAWSRRYKTPRGPADVAQLKKWIHGYKPERHEDEGDPTDEGDLVHTGNR